MTVPNGTGVGAIVSTTITLDSTYDTCIGLRVEPISSSLTLRLSINTQGGEKVQESTHINDYISSTAVPPAQRFKAVDLTAKGQQLTISAIPHTALVADQVFDVIFLLKNNP